MKQLKFIQCRSLLPLMAFLFGGLLPAQVELVSFEAIGCCGNPNPVTRTFTAVIPRGTASVTLQYEVGYGWSSVYPNGVLVPVNYSDSTYRLQISGPTLPSGTYEDAAGPPYERSSSLYALQQEAGCAFLGAPVVATTATGRDCVKRVTRTFDVSAGTASGPLTWTINLLALDRGGELSGVSIEGSLTTASEPVRGLITRTPRNWVPKNSENPSVADCGGSPGCEVSFTVTVQPPGRRAMVRLELFDVSRNPGDAGNHCMSANCQTQGDTDPDLFFGAQGSPLFALRRIRGNPSKARSKRRASPST